MAHGDAMSGDATAPLTPRTIAADSADSTSQKGTATHIKYSARDPAIEVTPTAASGALGHVARDYGSLGDYPDVEPAKSQPDVPHIQPQPLHAAGASSVVSSSGSASSRGVASSLTIHLNSAATNLSHVPAFPSNTILTSKYTWYTFLPLNLLEQFRRFANIYFLVITVMQGIPAISPFPIYTSLAPFMFILAVSALKEAVEDWGRHKADNQANGRSYLMLMEEAELAAAAAAAAAGGPKKSLAQPQSELLLGGATKSSGTRRKSTLSSVALEADRFRLVPSTHIRVGQILRIAKDEEFPADLLLLSSASSDATAFVNTANLDGEGVPKIRSAPSSTMSLLTPSDISSLRGTVVVERPSASMYRFQGRLQLPADFVHARHAASAPDAASAATGPLQPDGCYHYPLNDQQLLLRGSKLVNTAWVYGVVIYTGRETKLMLNRNAPKFKFSKFEQILNRFVVRLFIFNLLVCVALAAGNVIRTQHFVDYWDIAPSSLGSGWILNALTQYILFSFMIPMSLYVTIELVKAGQAKFMEWDRRLRYFDPDTGEWKRMIVKNSSICEELGNIETILADKTGTLTMNKMELTAVSVGGTLYRDVHSASSANGGASPSPEDKSRASSSGDTASLATTNLSSVARVNGSVSIHAVTVDHRRPIIPTAIGDQNAAAGASHVSLMRTQTFSNHKPLPQLPRHSSTGGDARAISSFNPNAANNSPLGANATRGHANSADDMPPIESDLIRAAARPSPPLNAANAPPPPPLAVLASDEASEAVGPITSPSSVLAPIASAFLPPSPVNTLPAIGASGEPTSPTPDILHTDLVLQDLVHRAFASLTPSATAPEDSIELDYLLDLLCCNSVMPMRKRRRGKRASSNAGDSSGTPGADSDSEYDEEEEEEAGGDAAVSVPTGHPPPTADPVLPNSTASAPDRPSGVPRARSMSTHRQSQLNTAEYAFSSSSPDEIALCESLDRCGLTLVERRGNHITIRYTTSVGTPPRFLRYAILGTLDFTSTLARMDVVVRAPNGRVKMFVKGSDQQVLKMVAAVNSSPSATALLETTSLQLSAFAKTGSRTLLMAGRTLSEEAANAFQTRYDAAANSLVDRESLIEAAFVSLEREGLELLGSSAVEDQLQEGVPAAVDFMLKGGLKLVILTGDKLETALTIGHQSRLLQPHMRVLQISASESRDNIESMLKENLRIVLATPPTDESRDGAEQARVRMGGDPATPLPPVDSSAALLGYALAIDGSSLEVCLRHFRREFIALFLHTATIISYRSTPKQKALAVQVVKEELGKTTLAIGDGANDVSMIQEANVGVGILGKEGSHAALSSDYVLYRFIHLVPLLFLHGRYNYYRQSLIVFFSFYKNMVFPVPMIIFSFYSFNSGQVLYIPTLMSCFNLFFTSIPPLITGWYERDVPEEPLLRHAAAYSEFKRNTIFTDRQFYTWMAEGLMHGFMLWYLMWGLIGGSDTGVGSEVVFAEGHPASLYLTGMQIFLTMIILVNIKMTTSLSRITWISIVGDILGLLALLLILGLLSFVFWVSFAPDSYNLLQTTFSTHSTWMYLLLSLVACYLPSGAINAYMEMYHPTSTQLMVRSCGAAPPADSSSAAAVEPDEEMRRSLMSLLERGGSSASPSPDDASHEIKTLHAVGSSGSQRRLSPPSLIATGTTPLLNARPTPPTTATVGVSPPLAALDAAPPADDAALGMQL